MMMMMMIIIIIINFFKYNSKILLTINSTIQKLVIAFSVAYRN